MTSIRKQLVVVGDRLLIKPAEGEERTGSGLYLPATAVSEQQVRSGRVVKVGPGLAIPEALDYDEPWKKKPSEPRYIPLQAREGDFAIFLQKGAIEVRFEDQLYYVVPMGAVLLLSREEIDLSDDLHSRLDGLDPPDGN